MEVTYKYRIKGVVQGVGFRPFVYKLAKGLGLNGWVLNDQEGVLIEIQGRNSNIDLFDKALLVEAPSLSRIDSIDKSEVELVTIDHITFRILNTKSDSKTDTLVPTDSYVCNDCLDELFDKDNKRYRYPFINCTNCGPRYSIIESMPYDRSSTTMKSFKMCNECHDEYEDVEDRRFHAQPIACESCGPELWLEDSAGKVLSTEDDVEHTISLLSQGYIVGIKSIGGFHLAVDANNDAAISLLRKRKRRDKKPFAIMVKDVNQAREYCSVKDHEVGILQSVSRPIVLMKKVPSSILNM